jgi:hypothetical protein
MFCEQLLEDITFLSRAKNQNPKCENSYCSIKYENMHTGLDSTNNRSKNQFAFVRSIGNELFVKKLTYAAEDEKKLMKYL